MRYLVLSDIHADVRALERVLRHAGTQGWDEIVFLGDAVGYGPEPEAAVQSLIGLKPKVALQGNHEAMLLAAARGEALRSHGPIRETIACHAQALSPASLAFIGALPRRCLTRAWGAVHGALRTPWEYLISVPVARANAALMQRPFYLVGHTHVPGVFVLGPDGRWRSLSFRAAENRFRLEPGTRAFLNPGSVSQPRDGVLGHSYALFDEARAEFTVFRLS